MIVVLGGGAHGGAVATLVFMAFSVVGLTIVLAALFSKLVEVRRELALARAELAAVRDLLAPPDRGRVVAGVVILRTPARDNDVKELPGE